MERVRIYAKTVEETALKQIKDISECEAYKGRMIRVMPDVHAGTGCTIGTCISIHDKIVPNTVGVDIGCGMEVVCLGKKDIDFDKLDRFIRYNIPCGCKIHDKYPDNDTLDHVESLYMRMYCKMGLSLDKVLRSIGTLGGGNHFIEIDKDDEGNKYLVIHSGSRNMGVRVCNYFQGIATNECAVERRQEQEKERRDVIDRLKAEGKQQLIQQELAKIHAAWHNKDLDYLKGWYFRLYINDMECAQEYADLNRHQIARRIIKAMKWGTVADIFVSVHNYIDTSKMILRKGACSAEEGERLVIPMNMRDGSLICVGKGNPDWLFSAPHGAGRLMSRKQAFDTLQFDDYKKSMKGIYSSTVDTSTIDEAPMVYKPMEEIISLIEPTVEVKKIIKPMYNFKASESLCNK